MFALELRSAQFVQDFEILGDKQGRNGSAESW